MKMAMELVENIGELTGVGPITKLIKAIINAASTVRKQNLVCSKFVRWLEMMEGLLKPLLKVPKLMEHPETRAPLKQLEESLKQAYKLVIKYKDRSYPYRFIMGSDIAERFSDMRNEIKDCIDLIPLIMLFVDQTIIHRVDTRSQLNKEKEMGQKKGKNKGKEMDMKKRKDKGEEMDMKTKSKDMEEGKKNKEQDMDQKKGKNKKERKNREEEMHLKKEKNMEEGKNREEEMNLKKGKNKEEGKNKENQKVKEKGRDKMKDMVNEKKKGRGREKDTGKGNMQNEEEKVRGKGKDTEKGEEENEKKNDGPPLVETAVLKVAMGCQCKGCPRRINGSIRKYPGVKKVVTELDEGILSVTVVGQFDANMLRDYVAEETKKVVELAGNAGRETEDHQVLEKMDHSKSICGEGKPKGGTNNNKKRVVPMIVAATVVLKVGDTGIRCECNGCVDKICDTLFNITGVQKVGIDTDKNQVTVTGTNMDIKNLQEKLGKKVRRPVEVMQTGMMDGKD